MTPEQVAKRAAYMAQREAKARQDVARLLNPATAPRGCEVIHVPARKVVP